MATVRGTMRWALAGLVCAAATGCVTQTAYDSIARSNLQLQDKLATSQADRVKARTQIALLRQELVQAKQAQQDNADQVRDLAAELDVLRARLDVQVKRQPSPAAATQPGQ